MVREIKILGYMPRGSCSYSKSFPMEEKTFHIDIKIDSLKWFISLCNAKRTERDFIPCIMLNEPLEPKIEPSLWGLHND